MQQAMETFLERHKDLLTTADSASQTLQFSYSDGLVPFDAAKDVSKLPEADVAHLKQFVSDAPQFFNQAHIVAEEGSVVENPVFAVTHENLKAVMASVYNLLDAHKEHGVFARGEMLKVYQGMGYGDAIPEMSVEQVLDVTKNLKAKDVPLPTIDEGTVSPSKMVTTQYKK